MLATKPPDRLASTQRLVARDWGEAVVGRDIIEADGLVAALHAASIAFDDVAFVVTCFVKVRRSVVQFII